MTYSEIFGPAPLFISDLDVVLPGAISMNQGVQSGPSLLEQFQKSKTAFMQETHHEVLEMKNYGSEVVGTDNDAHLMVITVSGAMWTYKYAYYRLLISRAIHDTKVTGIVFIFKTGGGAGFMLNDLAKYIQRCPKKTYAGIYAALSAGAKLAVSCDEVFILDKEASYTGSLGTMMEYLDWTGYYREILKADYKTLYADDSPDKNKESRQMKKGDDTAFREWLNKHNQIFLNHIKKARGLKDDSPALTGNVYLGMEGVKNGLADAYMSYDSLIRYAFLKSS